jgi:hypothetical protein
VEKFIPKMVTKTMNLHMLPNLSFVIIVSCSFDIWMFRGEVNTFALVITCLEGTLTSRHVIVGLFKVHETTSSAMALQLQDLLEKCGLIHHVITFVKNEGNNLRTMVTTLNL